MAIAKSFFRWFFDVGEITLGNPYKRRKSGGLGDGGDSQRNEAKRNPSRSDEMVYKVIDFNLLSC